MQIGQKPPGTYTSIAEAFRAEPEAVVDFLEDKNNKAVFFLKADNNFIASICNYFGIKRDDHYKNLKQIIKNRFDSFKEKFQITQEKIMSIINSSDNWSDFCLGLIDHLKKIKTPDSGLGVNKIKSLINPKSNSDLIEELIDILESIQINTGLNTAFDKIGNFLNLIPKKLKEVFTNETISKDNLINCLKHNQTFKTISYMMKALHVNEFIQLDQHLYQKSNSSHYDLENFSLKDGGIIFNPEKISKQKDSQEPPSQKCPYHTKKPAYDTVREGCPADTDHLKQLINFVGSCIQLIPDENFNELMQTVT